MDEFNQLDDEFGDDDGLGGIDAELGVRLQEDDDIDVQWEDDDQTADAGEEGNAEDGTEHAGQAPEDTGDDDDLKAFPDKIKKRIERERKLRREAVQAERQRAAQLEAELQAERAERQRLQESWQSEQSANIDQELISLRAQYRDAALDPDRADEQLDLMEKIQDLKAKKNAAGMVQEPKKPEPEPQSKPPIENKAAVAWTNRNGWFGKREYAAQTAAARAVDDQLAAEGYDTHSSEYFNELDRRLRKLVRVPGSERPSTESPVQSGRSTGHGGKRMVTLTRADQVTMRKLGFDPGNREHVKSFAREKLALER